MGIVERWNKLAKKKIYINDSFEVGVGRLIYMILLNFFIMVGMLLSGGNAPGVVWLWVDLFGSLKRTEKD